MNMMMVSQPQADQYRNIYLVSNGWLSKGMMVSDCDGVSPQQLVK